MFDFLEDFEKRMEFVAIIESIVNRKNTNKEIEDWFGKNELDNLFFTLLVYIMEQTLNDNEECTMENMTAFISKIIPHYKHQLSYDKVRKLTEYMVKDILQNGGALKTYAAINYYEKMNEIKVRLISDKITEDNIIIYQLTDQGYNFLFRTKEVDKELDFKLQQLKLRELLKRKNYKHAVMQSKELISMLRQKKRELDEFIYRIKKNIHEINKSEYERILSETYSLIDEEYEGMQDIRKNVELDEARLNQEKEENGFLDDTMIKAQNSLFEIKRNIQIVLSEQRNLINKRFTMNTIYEETIENSFYASIVKRYDFEHEILNPLMNLSENKIPDLSSLLSPLMLPKLEKIINLNLFYQRQGKLKETMEEELSIDHDELSENDIIEKAKNQNIINYGIIESFFKYAAMKKESFYFSDLYRYIEEKPKIIKICTENKRVFLIMCRLYEIQKIDIEVWKNRNDTDGVPEANGEFDLAWSLYHLEQKHPDFLGISSLSFEKIQGKKQSYTYSEQEEQIKTTIEMDEFKIIPIYTLGKKG